MTPVLMILISILLNGEVKLEHKVMTAFECTERRQINTTTPPDELRSLKLQNRGVLCVGLPSDYNQGTPANN